MTTTIRDINELQDRRIMMEKKLPPFGYALILLTAALILFLVVWSTKNYRTYVSQSSGSVQAANKTYIMSSYSGSITELNIAEGTYVNEGDLIAHIKSTDLDMQQDSIQSQLDIYKKQKSQYEKLVKSIQDDKNYYELFVQLFVEICRKKVSRQPVRHIFKVVGVDSKVCNDASLRPIFLWKCGCLRVSTALVGECSDIRPFLLPAAVYLLPYD